MDERCSRGAARLSLAQGLYYLVSGLWPLLSIGTFEAVTGPKADRWLVKTVGVLVGVIGGVLALAGRRGRVPPEVRLLAAGSAAGLGSVDAVYAARGRISRVYLLDALVEAALVAAWALSRRTGRCARGARGSLPAPRAAGASTPHAASSAGHPPPERRPLDAPVARLRPACPDR